MAYKHNLNANAEVKKYVEYPHFWNISAKVGWGCPNFPADVMLVQYMLYGIYYDIPSYLHPTPMNPLDLDGVFGPQTSQWIKEYQKKWVQISPSGKITPGDGEKYWSGPGKRFTIYLMNIHFGRAFPLYFDDLRMDPDLPSELCYGLSG